MKICSLQKVAFAVVLLSLLSSCKLFYPNTMFRQKDYQFFELAKKDINQYVINTGDQFTLRIYSRDGFKLVDVLGTGMGSGMGNIGAGGGAGGGARSGASGNQVGNSGGRLGGGAAIATDAINVLTFLVDPEGYANLPVLGMFYVKGYTEPELEKILEQKYSNLFVDPYVMLRVINRRAFVFLGNQATVVQLNEAPTSLFEVLARSGGLDRNLKAYDIKVIRGDLKNPQIQQVDLSTLEGIRRAELTIQSNDIVYVDQRKKLGPAIQDIAPIFSFITSAAALYFLVTNGRN
jgi:protein involved in polysaccharide export with SLBB domain